MPLGASRCAPAGDIWEYTGSVIHDTRGRRVSPSLLGARQRLLRCRQMTNSPPRVQASGGLLVSERLPSAFAECLRGASPVHLRLGRVSDASPSAAKEPQLGCRFVRRCDAVKYGLALSGRVSTGPPPSVLNPQDHLCFTHGRSAAGNASGIASASSHGAEQPPMDRSVGCHADVFPPSSGRSRSKPTCETRCGRGSWQR